MPRSLTFSAFCRAIAANVRAGLPGTVYTAPTLERPQATLCLGEATAMITRDSGGWSVTFERASRRPGAGLSGSDADPLVVGNVAETIRLFLAP